LAFESNAIHVRVIQTFFRIQNSSTQVMKQRSARILQPLIVCLAFLAVVGEPSPSQAQSARSGWGSTPYNGGVTFRVWAPNAASVRVAGQFNGWSSTANSLFAEGTSGVWSVDVPGAHVGQEYKYVINGVTPWKRDPRNRAVASSGSNSIIYDPNAFNWSGQTFSPPALKDAVVYELHVGTFYDPNPFDSSPGTFWDAINKLDYLKTLGLNTIEVMPVAEFSGESSWGYNPSDPFAVENLGYGGPDAFKAFVKACHERGLAVLLDTIHNHYGPTDLDLWEFDLWSGGGNGGGIYFYQQDGLCCTDFGRRPNYSRTQVRNYIKDNFRMWLDEYHVDGFRWDTPYIMMHYNGDVYIPEAESLIEDINNMISTQYSGKINICEDSGWVPGFNSEWRQDFHNDVTSQLAVTDDTQRDMNALSSQINGAGAGLGRVIYTESHDTTGDLNGHTRLPAVIDSADPGSYWARKRSTLGALLTLSSPGVPMLLEGQEMLEERPFGSFNALDWNKVTSHSGIVQLYNDLVHLRRNLDGVSSGLKGVNVNVTTADNTNKLIAWRRWNTGAGGDDVVVVANFANSARTGYTINFPKNGTWYVQFNSDWIKYSPDYASFGTRGSVVASGNPVTARIDIAKYSALIFSQVPPPNPDVDGDNLPDAWETAHSLNPNDPSDASQDPDNDGYSNLQEFQNGTDPHAWDSPTSNLSHMTMAGTFNGWNATADNMLLIRPGIWRIDITLTNQTNLQFKFAANETWSLNWGDNSRGGATIPISDFADSNGANIPVNGTLNGIYRFTFHDDTAAYTVEQITTTDADGDGVPDNWELAYGFNPNNPGDAATDTDGDGLTNLQEFQAGTNPRDPTSVLQISSVAASGSNFVIKFPSISGKLYRVEFADTIVNGAWPILANNIAGTGGTIQITDSTAAAQHQRFYRVRLLP
jgi:1,4-alpha-glucan branching enzyme